MTQGTIIRVAGPVVDVQFTEGKLPALQEALTVTAEVRVMVCAAGSAW